MAVPNLGDLPPDDTIIIMCPRKFQDTVDGQCKGIRHDAFRVDPDGISVTWVEYFTPPPPALEQAAAALKKTRVPSASGVLAHAKVGRILEVAQKLKLQASVTHSPLDENAAHSSILGIPDDPGVLLGLTLAFEEFTPNREIPNFVQ